MKTPQEPQNHTQVAYVGIQQLMFHNEIVPGQKISYRDLGKRLGMSVTPIIQALKFLEFQGLVLHEPNRGYHIAPLSMKEVEEVYVTREILETSLLETTISRLDENAIIRLQNSLESYLEAAGNDSFDNRLNTHKAFHLTLAALSGSRIRLQILQQMFDLLYLKFGGNLLYKIYRNSDDSVDMHERIVKAVVAREIEQSMRLLSAHIRDVKHSVMAHLGSMLSDKNQLFSKQQGPASLRHPKH